MNIWMLRENRKESVWLDCILAVVIVLQRPQCGVLNQTVSLVMTQGREARVAIDSRQAGRTRLEERT